MGKSARYSAISWWYTALFGAVADHIKPEHDDALADGFEKLTALGQTQSTGTLTQLMGEIEDPGLIGDAEREWLGQARDFYRSVFNSVAGLELDARPTAQEALFAASSRGRDGTVTVMSQLNRLVVALGQVVAPQPD